MSLLDDDGALKARSCGCISCTIECFVSVVHHFNLTVQLDLGWILTCFSNITDPLDHFTADLLFIVSMNS